MGRAKTYIHTDGAAYQPMSLPTVPKLDTVGR